MLEVHGGLLAWTVLTFLLLLGVLKKVAWGPIIDALETRENEIKDALNAAEKAREEAERVSSDYEESIRKAQAEAQQIISDGKAAGEKVKADIETAAQAKADEMLEKAKTQINAERETAINDIKAVAVEISLAAATKVISKNLDSDDNRKLVDEALEGIGQA
jgi:F-type H+-transporting ATPase subunit b